MGSHTQVWYHNPAHIVNFIARSVKHALDALTDKGYIYGSKRAKSVYLTEEGVERARNLEKRILPKFEE